MPSRRFLTAAEADALEDLAYGLTPQQIAAKRGIAYRTVIARMRDVRMKLKARTNAEAVRIAIERGYIR